MWAFIIAAVISGPWSGSHGHIPATQPRVATHGQHSVSRCRSSVAVYGTRRVTSVTCSG